MKTAPLLVVLAAVVALVVSSGSAPVPAQPGLKAAQFEYKFLPLRNEVPLDEKELNELAADRWEVVTATTHVMGANIPSDTRLVLKRVKR